MSLLGLSHALQLWHGLRTFVEDARPAPYQSCTPPVDESSSTPSSLAEPRQPLAGCPRVERIRKDLEYLSDKLIDMEDRISAVRAMVGLFSCSSCLARPER